MEKAIADRKSFIINFIYFGIVIGLYYFLVKYAFAYIFPFLFAAALAIFLQPIIRKISCKLKIKAHGFISMVLVLLIVVSVVGLLALVASKLVEEISGLLGHFFSKIKSVDDLVDAIKNWVIGATSSLPRGIGDNIAVKVNDLVENISSGETKIDFSMLSTPLSGALDVVLGLPSFLISIVVTIISCFFMTSEYDFIRDMVLGILPEQKGKKLVKAKKTVTQGIGKLVKAYSTIMLITFTEVFIGLSFMKLLGVYGGSYMVIISLVICVVDIVPVLGTGTVLIPWAVYSFVSGRVGMGIGLIVLYAVISVLRQVIEPKLVAHQAGLPSIVTIMAMFLGARIFGAFGIILLPLTVIVVKLMLDEGIIGASSHIVESETGEVNE